MIEIKNETEKVILVGVSLSDQDDTKESLEELKDLVSTAGAETVGMVIQNREQQHPGTYVGKGKIEEGYDADLCILDQDLQLVEVIARGKTVYTK